MKIKKKKFFFFFWGGGGQGRCEQRNEVFVKIKKKNWRGGGQVREGVLGGGGEGEGWM